MLPKLILGRIALQASIYSECHDIGLPNGIMVTTIAIAESWILENNLIGDFNSCNYKTYMYT